MSKFFTSLPFLTKTSIVLGKSPVAMHSLRYSSQKYGSTPGSHWAAGRDPADEADWKAQVLEEAYPKIKGMPPSKFVYLPKISPAVKNYFDKNTSSVFLKQGFLGIFDPTNIKCDAKSLYEILVKEAKTDNDAAAMLKLIKDVGAGKITHAHIGDGMPSLNIGGFMPSVLEDVMRSIVRVDNDSTSKNDTYETALRYCPSIAFANALFNSISERNFPAAISPINCFRTTGSQSLYNQRDVVGNERIIASALVGIEADGSVVTYVMDAEQLVHFLTEEDKTLLQQKVFYHPESAFGTESPSKQFALLEIINGKPYLKLEQHVFISRDTGADHQFNKILEKIDAIVGHLLVEGKITKMPIKTGEFAMMDNASAAWGRYNQNDVVPNFAPAKSEGPSTTIITPDGKTLERRVMNVNAVVTR